VGQAPENQKPPVITPGLLGHKPVVLNNTAYETMSMMELSMPKVNLDERRVGGRQTRTAAVDAPLHRFRGPFQYPLEN
jgi:hypothetical protein